LRDSAAERSLACPVCGAPMTAMRPRWWHVCGQCGMQASTLEPAFDDPVSDHVFDWGQRVDALSALREANAARLLDRLEKILPPPARLLDVGCAEGWFLKAARARGYTVSGIEPDLRMAGQIDPSLNIREGFFPKALGKKERFDVITFNDVFEHLPDVRGAMAACARHLTATGVLVINLPNALGGVYRLSRIAAALGITGPFRRMWQAGYPSPHLTYFTPGTLLKLAGSARLEERARFALPAVEPAGLWARVRYDRTRSLAYSIAAWCAVMAALPLLAMMPSDISVQIFAKAGATSGKRPRTARKVSSR
jgi:SAM-dependent methyltransferase